MGQEKARMSARVEDMCLLQSGIQGVDLSDVILKWVKSSKNASFWKVSNSKIPLLYR